MNVAEAAAKYHVSKQAIYQHLNKLPDKGRKPGTGVLNEVGEAALEAVYSRVDRESIKVEQAELNLYKDKIKALEDQLAAQKQAAEVLAVRLEAAADKVKALEGERDFLREQLSKAIVPRLPAADPAPEKEPEKKEQPEHPEQEKQAKPENKKEQPAGEGEKLTLWQRLFSRK